MFNQAEIVTIRDYIRQNAFKMLKPGKGVFPYPFIDPGAGYEDNLWDWDSFWSTVGLYKMADFLKDDPAFDKEGARATILEHARGSVRNFLNFQLEDGFIPMSVSATGLFSDFLTKQHQAGEPVNQHKPFLCQGILNVCRETGDYSWAGPIFDKVLLYLKVYDDNQYDEKSGLYFWLNDIMIGVDNNPAVFSRPDRSGGDLYLNCFLYLEFRACAEVAEKLGRQEAAALYTKKADKLAAAIQKECWDSRDGLFYSVDIQVHTHKTEVFHHGLGAFWNSIPLKIRSWVCFLPLYAGIATKEQAEQMVARHYHDKDFKCDYGVRTLSRDERMYSTECTSNPSNWLGPVWVISNYCVFKGLLNYDFTTEAAEIAEGTVRLLAADIRENGGMSESYVPETGKPMYYNGFLDWNILVVNMITALS